MSNDVSQCRIREVGRVVVPVSDQDRALEFYTRVLGFEVRTDAVADESGRWLEVAPPGAATTIAIVPPRGGMWGTVGVDTRISLAPRTSTQTTRRSSPRAQTSTGPSCGSAVPSRRSSSSAIPTATRCKSFNPI